MLKPSDVADVNWMKIWNLARWRACEILVADNLRLKKRLIGQGGIREFAER
jgi:hypothetical protein